MDRDALVLGAQELRCLGQLVVRSRYQHQVNAAGCQGIGDAEAHSLGAAGDDGVIACVGVAGDDGPGGAGGGGGLMGVRGGW